MTVKLVSATLEDRLTIDNLNQMYAHDLSEFTDIELTAAGRYDYPYLEFYWQDAHRYPFLIFKHDVLAGFCLVREDKDPSNGMGFMEVAEFFVLKSLRYQGVGNDAARQLWKKFPGNWQVGVLEKNVPAYDFWAPLIASVDSACRETAASKETNFQTVFDFQV